MMEQTNQPQPDQPTGNPEIRYAPFSNGSEADLWLSTNCYQCTRYRYEVENPEGCTHNHELEMAWFDDGTIRTATCDFIGTTERHTQEPDKTDGKTYHFCTLRRICRWRSDEANPPEIVDYDQPGQLKIEFPA